MSTVTCNIENNTITYNCNSRIKEGHNKYNFILDFVLELLDINTN